jgi:hypothetical protein
MGQYIGNVTKVGAVEGLHRASKMNLSPDPLGIFCGCWSRQPQIYCLATTAFILSLVCRSVKSLKCILVSSIKVVSSAMLLWSALGRNQLPSLFQLL